MIRRGRSIPDLSAEGINVISVETGARSISIESIMINAAARIVAKRDEAGAIVCTGSDKIKSGFGNGDCLLLDFENLVFAVSDGAERYSPASRDILERLAGQVELHGTPQSEGEWLERANEVFAAQRYQHKATLSMVALRREGERTRLTVIHGGDSMVLVYNAEQGELEFRTESDMNFVGRSKGISNIVEMQLTPGEHRIVIASDGLSDLARMKGREIPEYTRDLLEKHAIHEIPSVVYETLRERVSGIPAGNFDDISMIVLNPARLSRQSMRLLIGGTSPFEEAEYQRRVLPMSDAPGRIGETGTERGDMESCGIRLL